MRLTRENNKGRTLPTLRAYLCVLFCFFFYLLIYLLKNLNLKPNAKSKGIRLLVN